MLPVAGNRPGITPCVKLDLQRISVHLLAELIAKLCIALVPQVEGIALDEDSLTFLGEIGEETSLRHAVQVQYGVVQYSTDLA
jgi:DNA helicase TIP49 (TBP-interacting protein)